MYSVLLQFQDYFFRHLFVNVAVAAEGARVLDVAGDLGDGVGVLRETIADYQYNTVDAIAPVWRIRLLMLMNKPEDKSSPAILLVDKSLVTDLSIL
ncbi:MAG: hypothetical protein IKQ01_01395 [Bacteroidales bacterium]|nr:hypothetical protein [Bacteroidales bacterium]